MAAKAKRETYVDLSHTEPVCGSEPASRFRWRCGRLRNSCGRSTLPTRRGGDGTIEGSGIDYILPYWMGRYYGVIAGSAVESAAAPSSTVAPNSLASLYGANLAPGVAQASAQPLPLALAGVTLSVTDAAGVGRAAPLLYVAPGQINFVVPDGTAPGLATLAVSGQTFTAAVQPVAPTLFSMNGAGSGVAAATAIVVQAANPLLQSSVPVYQCDGSSCISVPIVLGVDHAGLRELLRHGHQKPEFLAGVAMTINGIGVPVLYAAPRRLYRAGPGQCRLGSQPARSGESNVVLTVDGQAANVVTINVE